MNEEPITINRADGRRSVATKVSELLRWWVQSAICLAISICLLLQADTGVTLVSAAKNDTAVTFSELNDNSVFLKESQSRVCTLTSSAMMVRRAAMLSGNTQWKKITEQYVRQTAWSEGVGLKWNFTSAGIHVAHKPLSSKTELIDMLENHPEGIVIYNPYKPHAILVTDYTDEVFYCSDPSNGSPYGRYPVSQASISVESASRCWYVTQPYGLTVLRDDDDYEVDNLTYRILDADAQTAVCTGFVKEKKTVEVPDDVEIDGNEFQVTQIANNAFAKSTKLKMVTIGANVEVIGKKAFYQCKKLKTIHIHTDSLQEIKANAFEKMNQAAEFILTSEDEIEPFIELLNKASILETVTVRAE